MGFDFNTWGKSWGTSWLNSWGRQQDTDERTAVPTLPLKKEEFFEEELLLMLYASKY